MIAEYSWNVNEGNDDSNELTTPVKKMIPGNDNESTADNEIIRFALVLHRLRRRQLLTHVGKSFYSCRALLCTRIIATGVEIFYFFFVSLFLCGTWRWRVKDPGRVQFRVERLRLRENSWRRWRSYCTGVEGGEVLPFNTIPPPDGSQPASRRDLSADFGRKAASDICISWPRIRTIRNAALYVQIRR